MGAAVGSPFYMVKTQLQARANASIAVGTQHPHDSMFKAFTFVVREHGVIGLWRGTTAAVSRVMFFQPNSFLNSLIGSICGGVVVVACMTPFDVVSTRMYNQPVNKNGKGIMYKNLLDCFVKIFTSEGLWGFYKGWGPSFFRLVPHTVLSLVFWDQLRILHGKWNEDESI
ncbi:S2535-like protein [Mya arenaria]|uniref:S2535-like protein n=1 Tax=Mya arenaria TaxID=6604 RepID=A0ABY7F0S7_MYAAR|nr:S2535-like protein [Mya arenaria]